MVAPDRRRRMEKKCHVGRAVGEEAWALVGRAVRERESGGWSVDDLDSRVTPSL